jgi:hypothetical protein
MESQLGKHLVGSSTPAPEAASLPGRSFAPCAPHFPVAERLLDADSLTSEERFTNGKILSIK